MVKNNIPPLKMNLKKSRNPVIADFPFPLDLLPENRS
jgi:hypothetical protein